ncbi:CmcJ/NvfI family oxidoreductase [Sphingomonas asaccharolytica]|uniref:CmcJ/NvfI family oxidoreductase n=1 Tax=Sphingomonas asaccharolytica TaxID=40681 RepID=UPI00247FCC66|nr:CmcJ/NvfI family oxidoreductase [Sphingomonas asaccharolytica]
MDTTSRRVSIADARMLQTQERVSEAEFLRRHGFVLLQHATAVRDWDEDIASVYLSEVEQIIRNRLLPEFTVEVHQLPNILRRGRDTATPFYADGVHSDGGVDHDDYAHNIAAFATPQAAQWWRQQYERDAVAGFIWLDFWRPTNMAGPLEHMPLALCDAATVERDDIVRTGITGIAPTGRETHHLSLRFNPGQRWYYYPRMTNDELLVFKLAEFWKAPRGLGNCFHSAFADPETPAKAEHRQSCEHRVGALILRT